MTIDAIFKAYTEVPARLKFQEEQKGKIKPGYFADFILLSDHPKNLADDQIKNLVVEETWSRGESIFQRR